MGKLAGKVPKLQEKCSIFRISDRSSTGRKKEQSATVPKDVYYFRYCFLETKECMHNEVGTCAEILPQSFMFYYCRRVAWSFFQVRTSTYDLET